MQGQVFQDGTAVFMPGQGVVIKAGLAVPTDNSIGYAHGCLFFKVNGSSESDTVYVNVGTVTACNFDLITSVGQIASTITISDSGSFTAQTTVEGALQEIYQDSQSTQGAVLFSVNDARLGSTAGAVLGAASFGGLLASDTSPSMGATNSSQAITWAVNDLNSIVFQTPLPPDLDGTANVNLALTVSSGVTDAANFSVRSSWDSGTQVVDAASDTAANAAHTTVVAIAAADVPDAPSNVTVVLTPPAHTTDEIRLYGAKLLYKKKLLTS